MEEFVFPMEDLSTDLVNFVFEKMLYQVFLSFNCCSKASAEMCQNLSLTVRLQADVFNIIISEKSHVYLRDFQTNGILVDFIPYSLNFHTIKLSVNIDQPELFHTFFKRHIVKTKELIVSGSITDNNLDSAQFLLEATDAKEWGSGDMCKSEAFFGLPEVQKLQKISCVPEGITDGLLWSLPMPNIHLKVNLSSHASLLNQYFLPVNNITEDGIYRFLMQCVRKERKIEQFEMSMKRRIDLESVFDRLQETLNVFVFRIREGQYKVRYSICRKEEPHKECLCVQILPQTRLTIAACEQSYRCPGTNVFK